tara:strand:- start:253 stop:1686 length:1434 start_codon:yes stop_codon:yes gene_type:complete
MLVGLVSIIVIIVILMYQKNSINNNSVNNRNIDVLENNVVENFTDNMENRRFDPTSTGEEGGSYRERYEELKKYMQIQGMYPMGQAQDMSKYVLKSEVAKADRCPDMSKYVLKSSVPTPVKCPTVNKDEWVRKSELPPNWNKDCPAHPDLTNYVLKSTIPPTQKCPSCICPKVKVDAALCKEPTKDDCVAKNLCKDACPPPKPCPKPVCPPPDPLTPEKCAGIIKCPEPKPCPAPPKVTCPKCPPIPEPAPCPRPPPPPPCPKPTCPTCPKPKTQGDCPKPERCPPAQDCPKCYGVKYVKVPVVKSEPLPKPEKPTIFPQNTIDTKFIRQHVPTQPRQPRILKVDVPEAAEENMAPVASVNDNTTLLQSLLAKMDQLTAQQQTQNNVVEPMLAPTPTIINNQNVNNTLPPVVTNNNNNNLLAPSVSNMNNRNNRAAPSVSSAPYVSSSPSGSQERCGPLTFNNSFKQFGILGFNNQS